MKEMSPAHQLISQFSILKSNRLYLMFHKSHDLFGQNNDWFGFKSIVNLSRVFLRFQKEFFIGISSEVFYRALRSLNVMHSRVDLVFPPHSGDWSVTDTGGCALLSGQVTWSDCPHALIRSVAPHAPLGSAHSRVGSGKGFFIQRVFILAAIRDKSGEAFSRLLQGTLSKDLSGCSY